MTSDSLLPLQHLNNEKLKLRMNLNTDFWVSNRNTLLRLHRRTALQRSHFINKSKERKSKQITHSVQLWSKSYCHQFLEIADLIVHLSKFLTIQSLNSFAAVNKTINDGIRNSCNLAMHHLQILVKPIMRLANKEYLDENGRHFYSYIRKSAYIYKQNKNKCIKGINQPFRVPTAIMQDTHCVTFQDVYTNDKRLKKGLLSRINGVDQPLHQFITSRVMETYHITFRNNPVSNTLKQYVSFSNCYVADCHLRIHTVDDFIRHWKLIVNVPTTPKLEEFKNRTWQKIQIETLLQRHFPRENKYDPDTSCRDAGYFIRYWQTYHYLHRFVHCINWENNLIMGGSVFQSIVAIQKDTIESPESDLDIFAYDIEYNVWLSQLIKLENDLVTKAIRVIKIIVAVRVYTYYLIFSDNKQIKLQFIYTCKSATPARILTAFDISACQIAFNPLNFTLITTYSFLEFMKTGYAQIFDLSQEALLFDGQNLNRIIKYLNKGVRHFKIPVHYSKDTFFKKLNKTQYTLNKHDRNSDEDFLAIQIGLNPVQYLSSKLYLSSIRKSSCCKSKNIDETHILKMFLNLLID